MNKLTGSKVKDTETAAETIIDSTAFVKTVSGRTKPALINTITSRQLSTDNFDNFIEKRNNR